MSASTPEMSSTLVHLSHPEHPLTLTTTIIKECVVTKKIAACVICHQPLKGYPAITLNAADGRTMYMHKSCYKEYEPQCYGCDKPRLGTTMYTFKKDIMSCYGFYLHKSCAELPTLINYHKHNSHPLTLLPRHDCILQCLSS